MLTLKLDKMLQIENISHPFPINKSFLINASLQISPLTDKLDIGNMEDSC